MKMYPNACYLFYYEQFSHAYIAYIFSAVNRIKNVNIKVFKYRPTCMLQ